MNVSLDIGLFFFRDAQFEKCSTGVKKKLSLQLIIILIVTIMLFVYVLIFKFLYQFIQCEKIVKNG